MEALYKLRARPGAEGFSAAWEAAIDRGILRLEDCAVELALRGEELPIASGGKLLGTYRKHNFGHIRFMLSHGRPGRYGRHVGRGEASPWGDDQRSEQEVLDSIDAMIDQMRERAAANAALLAEADDGEGDLGAD